jgi:hypothetical protein
VSRLCAPVNRLWAPAVAHYRRFFTLTAALYSRKFILSSSQSDLAALIPYLRPTSSSPPVFERASFSRGQEPDSQLTSGHPLHPLPPFELYISAASLISSVIMGSGLKLPHFCRDFQRIYSVFAHSVVLSARFLAQSLPFVAYISLIETQSRVFDTVICPLVFLFSFFFNFSLNHLWCFSAHIL